MRDYAAARIEVYSHDSRHRRGYGLPRRIVTQGKPMGFWTLMFRVVFGMGI